MSFCYTSFNTCVTKRKTLSNLDKCLIQKVVIFLSLYSTLTLPILTLLFSTELHHLSKLHSVFTKFSKYNFFFYHVTLQDYFLVFNTFQNVKYGFPVKSPLKVKNPPLYPLQCLACSTRAIIYFE